jgi:hypothetical protein
MRLQLLAAGQMVRVLIRDPAKAAHLGNEVDRVRGDPDESRPLAGALNGVRATYLISRADQVSRSRSECCQSGPAGSTSWPAPVFDGPCVLGGGMVAHPDQDAKSVNQTWTSSQSHGPHVAHPFVRQLNRQTAPLDQL